MDAMDDIEHYRCHHIYLKQSDEESQQAQAASNKFAGIEGIVLATPIDIHRIHLIYSLDHSILLSLRNTIYQYLEENARENLDIGVTSIKPKSSEGQEIARQSPDIYWEYYH